MNMKKIIGIGIIALIAIVSVGAVSADESLENVGCVLTPSVSEHTYEKGILTIPINNHVAGNGVGRMDNVFESCSIGDLNDIPGLEAIGAWDYTPCPEPSLPDVHADGNEVMLVGYFHNGDFPKSFNVDDWNGYTAGEFNPGHPEPTVVL